MGNMFQCKIDEIFSDMPNIFGIMDDILVIGCNDDGTDHDAMVHKVLQRCEEVNLKFNKEKCHFRCTSISYFGEVISRSTTRPTKKSKPSQTCQHKTTKKLQAFLGIINYLSKFSSGTADVCDPLCKLMLSKVTWTWNASYQSLFNRVKLLIKSDMCMKFYNDTKSLYAETDTSGVGLGAALLQTQEGATCQKDTVPDNTVLHPIAFACKSLTGTEHRYSDIEREALGILHGLEKFHHYCFTREVHVITNHKPLVSIFKRMWQCCHNGYSKFS